MKVMCEYAPCGPHFVRTGWGRAFASAGHHFLFWQPDAKSAHDAFAEFEPDLFIGTTYGLTPAIAKCVAARPRLRVALFGSAWGPYVADIDRTRYPLVLVTEAEKKAVGEMKSRTGRPDAVFIHAHGQWLEGTMSGWAELGVPYAGVLNGCDVFAYTGGKYREELACDVAFVGGYWGYKARNLDRFLIPLCQTDLKVRLYGNQPWPVPQYLGVLEENEVRDLFVSATVCPNVSEPHSTDPGLGWDLVERPLKILGAGGFCVSDHVPEGRDLFAENELVMAPTPDEFADAVRYFVRHPERREPYVRAGREAVLSGHTYHHRVATLLGAMGMHDEASGVLAALDEFLPPIP